MLSFSTLLFILAAVLMGALGWLLLARPALKRARAYITDVSTCGYLAPPPTPGWVRFLNVFCSVVTWIQVGRIRILGEENLPPKPPKDTKETEPFLVCPNHPHYVDPGVVVRVIRRPARYMAARGVFTFLRGFGALLAGPCGAFSVDLTQGKGGPAREAAIKVLTTNQVLVMFPEGWAYLDGKMGEMKKGAVRIAKEAAAQLGKPVKIVPVYLRYGRNPGSWIRKLPPTIEYLYMFLNSWYYRRGVTVVIGQAISSADLPDDDDQATEILKDRITDLDPLANG
jgi:1-acyl-sn-glycerol-3-phosphate acyltransferase